MKDNSKVAALLAEINPWCKHENAIWLCSTLTLLRNLQKFHFPSRLDVENRKQILGLIGKELGSYVGLKGPKVFDAEECSSSDKELLFEHFFATHPFVPSQGGEAFVLDQSGNFLGLINIEDHLELTKRDCKEELEKPFEELFKIESDLGAVLNYAFSPTFGFLTTNPAHCGTGLIIRLFLQIPAIIHLGLLQQVISKNKSEIVETSSLTGNKAELVGDVLVVANAFTLGVTEEQILSAMRTFTTHLVGEEKELRERIGHEKTPVIKDKVGRAFGLLKYSHQLETAESLNALSLLKLGLDINWIKGTTHSKLNELFYTCRRAHLMALAGAEIPQEDLAHRRAMHLRETLHDIQLEL